MATETLENIKSAPDMPKWEAIKEHLVLQIRYGKYRPGEPVPSENWLAKYTGVARNTVRQAIYE